MSKMKNWLQAILALALVAGGTSGCTKQAKRERYLARANRDFDAGQYDKAEIEYRAALMIPPPSPVAVSRLGVLYYTEGRLPQAFAFLQKARELAPENLEARTKLGLTYLALRKLAEARAEALFVLQKRPDAREALLLLGDATGTNEIVPTLEWLASLPAEVKAQSAYHLARGALFMHQPNLTEAEAELRQALALDPDSSQAHFALANLFLLRNDLKQAEPAMKRAASLAPLRSIIRLLYAEFQLKTGAAREAREGAESLVRQAPDYIPARLFLAQLAFAERRHEDCAALLEQILARDPPNLEAQMLQGDLLLGQGDGTNAVAHFERMAAVYEHAPQVRYKLALARLLNQDYAQVVADLNRALALQPGFSEAMLLLAEMSIRRGDTASGIATLKQLLKDRPQVVQAYILLAGAYLAQKNPDQALSVYRQMASLFPADPQPLALGGIVLAQQDKRDEARQAFEQALRLAPGYLLALEQLVDLDLREKEYSRATELVAARIEKDKRAAEPWLLLAKIHLARAIGQVGAAGDDLAAGVAKVRLAQAPAAQAELHEAETALRTAIQLNPNLRLGYLLLARLYVALDKHAQALDQLAGLAKTNDVTALMQIGMIQEQLTNFPAAREAYEKLLAVAPRFSPALNNLAYLYSERLGQLDRAYLMAQRARQLLPYDPYTADTLGWILCKRGEPTRALGLIGESALKLQAEPEVQFHLGMAHYLLGEEDAARVGLRFAAQSDKAFPGKDEGKRCLELLDLDVSRLDAGALAGEAAKLREYRNDPVAAQRLGAIQERQGAFAQARDTYESALKKFPQNVPLLLQLAELCATPLKDTKHALELAKEAHDAAPEDIRASALLGRLAYQAGDYVWAASLLEGCARRRPGDADLAYDLAWACYSLGRLPQAGSSMQSALQDGLSSPKAEDAKRFLELLKASRDPAQAEANGELIRETLAQNPAYIPALMASAILQERRGQFSAAAQTYDAVLARFPLFTPAMRNLAVLCFEHLGNEQKAFNLGVKAQAASAGDPVLARTLGILYYRRGDPSSAARLLQESLSERANDGELFYYFGMANAQLKERARSREALQRALALGLPADLAIEARRALDTL